MHSSGFIRRVQPKEAPEVTGLGINSQQLTVFGQLFSATFIMKASEKALLLLRIRKSYAEKLSLHTHKQKNVKTCSDQKTTRIYKESVSNEYSLHIKLLCIEKCLINAA